MMRVVSVAVALSFSSVLVSAYDNGAPHSKLPPLGWSSWVALGPGDAHPIFDFCDEASVKAAADAYMESGLYDHGYRHFHLDDCWAGGRNDTGFLYGDKQRFPNNMKPVIDYVHAKGLTFGLYTCGGEFTCVGGRPGSKDHWVEDAQVFAEWGVDWVKMDWCGGKPQDPLMAYGNMSKAMNATGRHMHFNMCEWGTPDSAGDFPWQWGPDVAQSWRMGGDHTPVWTSTKSVISQSVDHAAKFPSYPGKPYAWNDMDMIETGNYAQAAHANGKEGTMTDVEYKTEFSMWAIAASPLVVTTPIMNCTSIAPPSPPVSQCSISLVKKTSNAACVANVSFGCDNTGTMWTQNGCRGDFMCDGKDTACDVDGNGKHVCQCGPPGPVTCKAVLTDLQKEILFNDDVIAVNQDVTPQGIPVMPGNSSIWARFLSDGSVAVAFYNENDAAMSTRLDFSALAQMNSMPATSAGDWGPTTKANATDLWMKSSSIVTGGYPASGTISVAPHETKMFRFYKQ
eukprot:m.104590 g.104590  ORF g.104590 m.104590 type:complete len:510 (-) comp27577_c0_seq1:36-1565(-)